MPTNRPANRSAALAALALAAAGLLGLTACGADAPVSPGSPDHELTAALDAALDADEQALAALGFDPVELVAAAAPAATPSARPSSGARKDRDRRPLARELLRGRVLHAEAVVQTRDGIRTVVSQRGSVTEVDQDSITVRSADGFSLTWAFGDKLRVVEHRRSVQPSAVAVGAEVGVAGAEDGDRAVARLIVLRR